jgi:hypothetical protein
MLDKIRLRYIDTVARGMIYSDFMLSLFDFSNCQEIQHFVYKNLR